MGRGRISRPLRDVEREIVARVITMNELPPPDPVAMGELRVVGTCGCGCASVDFVHDPRGAHVLADGYGVTQSGVAVGVIVWARDAGVTGLEIYPLSEDTSELPVPTSLHRGEGAPAVNRR